jgi:hypothetical protein
MEGRASARPQREHCACPKVHGSTFLNRYRAVFNTQKSDIGLYFDLFLKDFEIITDS